MCNEEDDDDIRGEEDNFDSPHNDDEDTFDS
jgi:hypothetical protein